jgi:diaminopimelate epimerase
VRFTKMEGCGNDYVYVSLFDEQLDLGQAPLLAQAASDRRFGIGSDGLIVLGPAEAADCRMQMWNADGSRAEMCGNGIRCVAKLAFERGWVRRERMRIETDAGIKEVAVTVTEGGRVDRVSVDLGPPVFERARIPVRGQGTAPVAEDLRAGDHVFSVSILSVGNPHCVVFLRESPEGFPVETFGPLISAHESFPRGTNVEFVWLAPQQHIVQRTYERGSGETLACGTGACAAAVATIRRGLLAGTMPATVRLRGGDLEVRWEGGSVSMTGPATEVFSGEWTPPIPLMKNPRRSP